jgi:hypothetical protein
MRAVPFFRRLGHCPLASKRRFNSSSNNNQNNSSYRSKVYNVETAPIESAAPAVQQLQPSLLLFYLDDGGGGASGGLLQYTLSFLTLEEVWHLQGTCRAMVQACRSDTRWVPHIAPPTMTEQPLSMSKHGPALRWLYMTQYLPWYQQWKDMEEIAEDNAVELTLRMHSMDGYFSLAPWNHQGSDVTTYPTPWLHRMVHVTVCPTTTTTTATTTTQKDDEAKLMKKKKTKKRSWNFRSLVSAEEQEEDDDNNNDADDTAERECKRVRQEWQRFSSQYHASTFFHRRPINVDADWEHSNWIPLTSILPAHAIFGNGNASTTTTKGRPLAAIVIQPVNLRKRTDGKPHERLLPDLDMTELTAMNGACQEVLACYFGPKLVHVAPLATHKTSLCYGRYGTLRKDPEGTPAINDRGYRTGHTVMQVKAEALKGMAAAAAATTATKQQHDACRPNANAHTLVVHVIAPHVSSREKFVTYGCNCDFFSLGHPPPTH